MHYCPKCRKKLVVPDFCVECGADLSEYLRMSEGESTSAEDFEINGNVLIKYKGKARYVIIPQG